MIKIISDYKILNEISGGVDCRCGFHDAMFGAHIETKKVEVEAEKKCIDICCAGSENAARGILYWYSFDGSEKYCPREELSLEELVAGLHAALAKHKGLT